MRAPVLENVEWFVERVFLIMTNSLEKELAVAYT